MGWPVPRSAPLWTPGYNTCECGGRWQDGEPEDHAGWCRLNEPLVRAAYLAAARAELDEEFGRAGW
jgi:hypothetical protein